MSRTSTPAPADNDTSDAPRRADLKYYSLTGGPNYAHEATPQFQIGEIGPHLGRLLAPFHLLVLRVPMLRHRTPTRRLLPDLIHGKRTVVSDEVSEQPCSVRMRPSRGETGPL